jgi:hypothetical protein
MTYHDANITRFGQWARRMSRAGYAYAARAFLHASDGTGYCLRENLRIVAWAAFVPMITATAVVLRVPFGVLLLLIYPLQVARIFHRSRRTIRPLKVAFAYSALLVVGKFFEFYGQMKCVARRVSGVAETLIEYK